jgi:hypothetical protein
MYEKKWRRYLARFKLRTPPAVSYATLIPDNMPATNEIVISYTMEWHVLCYPIFQTIKKLQENAGSV